MKHQYIIAKQLLFRQEQDPTRRQYLSDLNRQITTVLIMNFGLSLKVSPTPYSGVKSIGFLAAS